MPGKGTLAPLPSTSAYRDRLGGPVGEEVEGAAVGDEADLVRNENGGGAGYREEEWIRYIRWRPV